MHKKKIFPFNYYGCKTCVVVDLLKDIIKYNFDVFIEAFAGSAEVSYHLMEYYKNKGIKKTFIINDINNFVYNLHYYLYFHNGLLYDNLKQLTKPEYLNLEDKKNKNTLELILLYINQRFPDYYVKNKRNLYLLKSYFKKDKIKYIKELMDYHDVVFFNLDYKLLLDNIIYLYNDKNIVVYFDPPYVDTITKYNIDFDINGFIDYIIDIKKYNKFNMYISYNINFHLLDLIYDKEHTNQSSMKHNKPKRREFLFKYLIN